MTNTRTPRATDNGSIFDGIRPAVIAYADHARKADRTGAMLKDHPDVGAIWDRVAFLTMSNAKKITLTVAREVLGYDDTVTLTRKDGKPLSPDAARLEAVKKWIERNNPTPATPKTRALTVSLSGEGGGSAKVAEDHPFYAALALMATGDADADTLVAMVMEAHAAKSDV